jgi:hypothetical protein
MKRPYPLLAILLLLTGCGGGQSAAPTTAQRRQNSLRTINTGSSPGAPGGLVIGQ